jgi:hypothetical protein
MMAYKDPAMRRACDKRSYDRNRDRKLPRERARSRRKRFEVRQFILEYLLSHPCVDCGEDDPIVLDFDHVGEKRFNICRASNDLKPIPIIAEEIARCEVRCANCHRRKTHATLGYTARCPKKMGAVLAREPGPKDAPNPYLETLKW